LILGLVAFGTAFAPVAGADTVGPITFESTDSPAYQLGDINGQNLWMKTGGFDVAVASVPVALASYGFQAQALRMSDSVTSGSFGDQTFSPGLTESAGESPLKTHFEAGFSIGTALATVQTGLHMSVSPDDGNGARMSYLRFEDAAKGVNVFFSDVNGGGSLGTVARFSDTRIATLSRSSAHTIRFVIDFATGPGNDVVKIVIDGKKQATGRTWENYYRFDPEAAGSGNLVPSVSKLLFRESGTANTGNAGNGFLIDGVTLASS
jgi:hypothetical protein